MKRVFLIFAVFAAVSGCVPKTQYDDQKEKLDQSQAELRQAELIQTECDPNTLVELREQAQALDILTQELVDRNTELAEEVARLRVFEAKAKNNEVGCDKRIEELKNQHKSELARTRATYEDLIKELRLELKKAENRPKAPTKP